MARLIVREGETTRIFELGDEQVGLGRATDNDITLEDSKSSRNHAALRRTATGYELIDLESRNGTRVNGEPVKQRLLKDGDVIQIGQATITYTLQDEAAETEALPPAGEDTGEEEDEPVVEGLEVAPPAPGAGRRLGRGRRFGRRERTPVMLHSPGAPPVKPQPPAVIPDPRRNAETHEIESPEQLSPDETPVDALNPTPSPRPQAHTPVPAPKAASVAEERSSNMRKFHLLDQGRIRTFARVNPDQAGSIPMESLFADVGELVPWDEILKTEGKAADRPGAALLMELKDSDTQKASLLLVDSTGFVTVVEDGSGEDVKAHRALIGKGINLAALLATEWNADTLKREFEAYCRKVGREPAGVLQTAFGKAPGPDFWKGVERNLQAGGIRVIFLVREPTVAIQKVIDFLFGSTNMTAYALQLEAFQEIRAEKPRIGFTVKLYGPSKSARQNRSSKTTAAAVESSAASAPALDVVSM